MNNKLEKIGVLGLGNPLLTDDTIGLKIIDHAKKKLLQKFDNVVFNKNYSGGLDLLYDIIDFSKLIIVDSIPSDDKEPGFCHEFIYKTINDLLDNDDLSKKSCNFSSHGINIKDVINFGIKCGYKVPSEIIIYGICGSDFTSFNKNPTPLVEKSINHVVDLINKKFIYWRNN